MEDALCLLTCCNFVDISSSASCFSVCSFSHVIKSVNNMAHALVAWDPFCTESGALCILSICNLPASVFEVKSVDGLGPAFPPF